MMACVGAPETDLGEVETTSQAITASASRFGCPPGIKYIELTTATGYYCGAIKGDGWMACYTKDEFGGFTVYALDDGPNRVALKTNNGRFVSATNGGGGGIWNTGNGIGAWESFSVGLAPGYTDRYYLQTNDRLHFVTAEGGGGGVMNANRTNIGPWEMFKVRCMA